MRAAACLLFLLAAVALFAGCATTADKTWIHPATGHVQPGTSPTTN